jgi:Protein of unknown function (DUF1566)
MKHTQLSLSAIAFLALLAACSGGGDATAPTETTVPAPTPTPTPTPTPASGFGLVSNAAGGSYPQTDCVKDYSTGLTWEAKHPANSSLRYVGRTYTNYDNTSKLQVGTGASSGRFPTVAEINDPSNSIGFVNAVNASALCGFTDWRRPTKEEIETLSRSSPNGTDTTWLPLNAVSSYWTSTPDTYPHHSGYVGEGTAWFMIFYANDPGSMTGLGRGRNNPTYLRLVR